MRGLLRDRLRFLRGRRGLLRDRLRFLRGRRGLLNNRLWPRLGHVSRRSLDLNLFDLNVPYTKIIDLGRTPGFPLEPETFLEQLVVRIGQRFVQKLKKIFSSRIFSENMQIFSSEHCTNTRIRIFCQYADFACLQGNFLRSRIRTEIFRQYANFREPAGNILKIVNAGAKRHILYYISHGGHVNRPLLENMVMRVSKISNFAKI